MGLLQRMKHDVRAGWASLRYGTAKAATRALEETELLRLRLDLRKLDERIKDLCGDIGERAVVADLLREGDERGEGGTKRARGFQGATSFLDLAFHSVGDQIERHELFEAANAAVEAGEPVGGALEVHGRAAERAAVPHERACLRRRCPAARASSRPAAHRA